jgi:hypothetical protein
MYCVADPSYYTGDFLCNKITLNGVEYFTNLSEYDSGHDFGYLSDSVFEGCTSVTVLGSGDLWSTLSRCGQDYSAKEHSMVKYASACPSGYMIGETPDGRTFYIVESVGRTWNPVTNPIETMSQYIIWP